MKTLKIYLLFPLFLSISLNLHAQQNVGIGTNNPQAKLHIAGDLQVEDLAGQGERKVVATSEGKLKAITNTEPTPSNADTLSAQFIELTDEAGNTRFIFNAHTGQFQMMDNDTVWYEIEVNSLAKNGASESSPNIKTQLDNGKNEESSNQAEIAETIENAVLALESKIGEDEEDEETDKVISDVIDLLNNESVSQVETKVTNEDSDSPEFESTFFITDSEGNKIELIVNFFTFQNLNFLNFFKKKNVDEFTFTQEEETDISNVSTVAEKTRILNKNGEAQSKTQSGINQNNQPFAIFTDFLNSTTNTLFSNENTISNTETGGNVSSKIDETGTPKVQLTIGGSTVTTIDAEKIEQTDGETGENTFTLIGDILNSAKELIKSSQEQGNQRGVITENTDNINSSQENNLTQSERINQIAQQVANSLDQNNTQEDRISQTIAEITNRQSRNETQDEEIQDLIDCVTELQDEVAIVEEETGEEFTATDDTNTGSIKPTELNIQSDDGTEAVISPSGIILTAPNGAQLFLDCFALSKFIPGKKSLPFVGVDFNINQEKLDVFADLNVFGNITELGKKVTKIDHPNHPTQQYLQHSTVNTNELLQLYSGNSTTNTEGKAIVQLPSYIQDLNTDFRYQLTVISDTFAQAIIAQKMTNNQFVIQTNEPNVKVSWQVTGVRNDTYAQQNPLEVEVSD